MNTNRKTFSFFFLQGKKLPANLDPDAEEGDVSDEDSGDEEAGSDDDDTQASKTRSDGEGDG